MKKLLALITLVMVLVGSAAFVGGNIIAQDAPQIVAGGSGNWAGGG